MHCLACLALCCLLVLPAIATDTNAPLAERLVHAIRTRHLEKQRLRSGEHDGFALQVETQEDRMMKTIDGLSPADMVRLEEEMEKPSLDKWIRDQVRRIKQLPDYQPLRLPGGLVETPLGNISEACYNDTTMMGTDWEAGKEYAMKMAVSWGSFEYLVERFEYYGKFQDLGFYDLCTDNRGDYPFSTQYCSLDVLQGLKIGTCWSTSCSPDDLTAITWTWLGWQGIIYLPWYQCEARDVEWFGGAIATVTVIIFFAAIVALATVYHLTLHHYIKHKIAELSKKRRDRKTPMVNGKVPDNVYSQAVSDSVEETAVDNETTENGDEAAENGTAHIYEKPGLNGDATRMNEKPESNGKQAPDDCPQNYGSFEGDDDSADCEVEKKIQKYDFIDTLILSSSALFNADKYMDCTVRSPQTLCLNGLRVISMFWIILGHTIVLGTVKLENQWSAAEAGGKFLFQVIDEFHYGVDTFFLLSGLLLSYHTLKQLDKGNGSLNWGLFYFHRFWRITPTYMLILAVWANLVLMWGQGPYHDGFGEYVQTQCSEKWWIHLLYINNLYPYPGSVDDNVFFRIQPGVPSGARKNPRTIDSSLSKFPFLPQCMGWTWYLADDMQFFIISPFILYLLYRSWKKGIALIAVMLVTSYASTIYLVLHWGIGFASTGWYNDRAANDDRPGDDYIYAKPWSRIPPYLFGILFGFMLYKLKGRTINIKPFKAFVGWTVAANTAFWIVYGTWYTSPETPQWVSVLYNVFGRSAFALSVAWVAFACINGRGGLVNKFLSWSIWIPLGRLTFAAYLFHPTMIMWVTYTMKTMIHWSYVEFSYYYLANVFYSYACAFVFMLLIEGPTGSLEDAWLGSRRRGNKAKS